MSVSLTDMSVRQGAQPNSALSLSFLGERPIVNDNDRALWGERPVVNVNDGTLWAGRPVVNVDVECSR